MDAASFNEDFNKGSTTKDSSRCADRCWSRRGSQYYFCPGCNGGVSARTLVHCGLFYTIFLLKMGLLLMICYFAYTYTGQRSIPAAETFIYMSNPQLDRKKHGNIEFFSINCPNVNRKGASTIAVQFIVILGSRSMDGMKVVLKKDGAVTNTEATATTNFNLGDGEYVVELVDTATSAVIDSKSFRVISNTEEEKICF